MVGLEEGLFPSVRMESHGGSEDEEIEEERRLCYVGMTRARKKLFLSHAKLRRIWGQFLYQEPARFLQEIPTQYLQNVSTRRTGNAPFGHPTTGVAVEMNHPDYGTGRVISQDGAGEHAKILVEFSGGDRKRFLLRFVQEYLSNR
jgi:DNA helicase-2/ATP-dependent DNA helicase PcrA